MRVLSQILSSEAPNKAVNAFAELCSNAIYDRNRLC